MFALKSRVGRLGGCAASGTLGAAGRRELRPEQGPQKRQRGRQDWGASTRAGLPGVRSGLVALEMARHLR